MGFVRIWCFLGRFHVLSLTDGSCAELRNTARAKVERLRQASRSPHTAARSNNMPPPGKPPPVTPVYAHVHNVVLQYELARKAFVNGLNDLLAAGDPGQTDALLRAGVVNLLHAPLVQGACLKPAPSDFKLDPVSLPTRAPIAEPEPPFSPPDANSGVQVAALAAMRTLTQDTEATGEEIAEPDALKKIVASLTHRKTAVAVAGCAALQALAEKRPDYAAAMITEGALPPLRLLMASFDPDAKEAAARCLTAVAQAGEPHARSALDDGDGDVLELATAASADPDASFSLRLACARFFDACCDHGASMARRVVLSSDAAACAARLARDASMPGNPKSARAARAVAFASLTRMAQNGEDMAAMVAETGAVMDAVAAVTDESDASARECAAAMLREIACKTADLAEKVAADGGIAGLVQCLAYDRGDKRSMFAAQTLGYIADFKPSLAMAVVGVDRGRCLVEALDHAPDADSATAAAWAIGCVARHGREGAAQLAKAGALKSLTDAYAAAMNAGGGGATNEALADRCKASVKSVIKNGGALGLLEGMVNERTPPGILRHVLAEFAAKLMDDVKAKRSFVTSGALMRLQAVIKKHDSAVAEAAAALEACKLSGEEPPPPTEPLLDERAVRDAKRINGVFPADVVSYYLYC